MPTDEKEAAAAKLKFDRSLATKMPYYKAANLLQILRKDDPDWSYTIEKIEYQDKEVAIIKVKDEYCEILGWL